MTTETTPTAATRLRLYQSAHTIQRITLEDVIRGESFKCSVDGIRIFPVKGGRWRHDPDEIVRLMDETYGGAWPR